MFSPASFNSVDAGQEETESRIESALGFCQAREKEREKGTGSAFKEKVVLMCHEASAG